MIVRDRVRDIEEKGITGERQEEQEKMNKRAVTREGNHNYMRSEQT